MGLFSKDPAKEREAAQNDVAAALAKAEKRGINVQDAIAAGATYDDSAEQFLIVFADRVDLVNLGKKSSFTRAGAGTSTTLMSQISSVQCQNKGAAWSHLAINTSGAIIEFKAAQRLGPYLRQIILDQMNSSASSAPVSAATTDGVAEQLLKLSELHKAGVLTDDEYETKRAQLVDRL